MFHEEPNFLLTADDFLADIGNGSCFSFSKWGNGEWACITQKSGISRNHDRHPMTPALGKMLEEIVLSRPKYRMGNWYPDRLKTWYRGTSWDYMVEHGLHEYPWYDVNVLYREMTASINENRINKLIPLLRKLPVVVVGPKPLRRINKVFTCQHFVEVPAVNCFLELESTMKQLKRVAGILKKPTFFSFSANMPANVMIHRMHQKYGDKHWFVDIGSMWDPYVGRITRKYHERAIGRLVT